VTARGPCWTTRGPGASTAGTRRYAHAGYADQVGVSQSQMPESVISKHSNQVAEVSHTVPPSPT
jgi:hypothetical protein